MEPGVATLQQRLTETERLAEDVLLCKDLLVDNDRQRNGCREALSALRRIERARQPQKHPQPPLRSPAALAAAAATTSSSSRGLSDVSSSSSSQRLDADYPAALLRVTGVGAAGTGSVSGSVSRDLLFSTASPARAVEAKKQQARVLVEELPDRRIVEAAADGAPAGSVAAVSAGSSASAGEAASIATQELRGQQPEQQQEQQEGQQQQEQEVENASVSRHQLQSDAAMGPSLSSWQSVSWGLGGCCSCSDRAGSGRGDSEGKHSGAASLWMAFPCGGAIGDGTYGIFFRAPAAVVKAQLQRDLEEFDGAAKSLRERQKSALDRVAEQNALAVGPSLVKAITSLKDGPPSAPSTAAGLSLR